MADIPLRELMLQWASQCTDYTERPRSKEELELTLNQLGSSIGFYADHVPLAVMVPAPAGE